MVPSTVHVIDIMTGYCAFSFTLVKTCPALSREFEAETKMTIPSLNNNLKLYEMLIQYHDCPEGSYIRFDAAVDGIKVMSTMFRGIREYGPLPFFGITGLVVGIVGRMLTISVMIDFLNTGMVAHFSTLIGAVPLIIVGLLLIVAGIVFDVMAKNNRKQFIVDAKL